MSLFAGALLNWTSTSANAPAGKSRRSEASFTPYGDAANEMKFTPKSIGSKTKEDDSSAGELRVGRYFDSFDSPPDRTLVFSIDQLVHALGAGFRSGAPDCGSSPHSGVSVCAASSPDRCRTPQQACSPNSCLPINVNIRAPNRCSAPHGSSPPYCCRTPDGRIRIDHTNRSGDRVKNSDRRGCRASCRNYISILSAAHTSRYPAPIVKMSY